MKANFTHILAVALLVGCNGSTEVAAGSSATIEGTTYDVSPRIAARIKAIHVDEGDAVKKGEVLVELECDDADAAALSASAGLEAAKAHLQQAQAQRDAASKGVDVASLQTRAAGASVTATRSQIAVLDAEIANAERTVQRLTKLRASGGGTAKQLDDAHTHLDVLRQKRDSIDATTRAALARKRATAGGEVTAKSKVALADAGVALAQADIARATAAVDKAQWYRDGCKIMASDDGTVQLRSFEPGEFVGPGTPILRVVNTKTVKATFYVPNRDLNLAAPGVKVGVVADAMPSRTFQGTVQSVSQSAEFTPRSIQTRDDRERLVYAVKAQIPNPKGALHPGMPVEISLKGAK